MHRYILGNDDYRSCNQFVIKNNNYGGGISKPPVFFIFILNGFGFRALLD